jgi:hypothetical protein
MEMFPGSFIWRHISDEWLLSKTASRLFAVSSILVVTITFFLLVVGNLQDFDPVSRLLLDCWGALGAASIFFLWGGMWKYWINRDPSERIVRRIWFVVLLFGVWYGAVLYYLFVFLPKTKRDGFKPTRRTAR